MKKTSPLEKPTKFNTVQPKYKKEDMFELPISKNKKVEITADAFEQEVSFFDTVLKGKDALSIPDEKVLQVVNKFLNEGMEKVDPELLVTVHKDINQYFESNKDSLFEKYNTKYGRTGFQKFHSIEHANECILFMDVARNSSVKISDIQSIFFNKLASGKIEASKNFIRHAYELIMNDVSFNLTDEDKGLMNRAALSISLINTDLDYADILGFSTIAFRAFSKEDSINAAHMHFAHQLYAVASSNLTKDVQKNAIINGLGLYLSAIMPKEKPIGEFSDLDGIMNQIEFNDLYEFVDHNPLILNDIIENEKLNILHFLSDAYEKDAIFNAMIQESSLDTISKIHVINYYYKNIFNK